MQNFTVSPLAETLIDNEKRKNVIADLARMADAYIHSLKGISSVFIKTGYTAVVKTRKDALPHYLDLYIDDFVEAVEPWHCEYRSNPQPPLKTLFEKNNTAIANALLNVTDKKIHTTTNPTITKIYKTFRPQAQKHINDVIPRLADIIDKHTLITKNSD